MGRMQVQACARHSTAYAVRVRTRTFQGAGRATGREGTCVQDADQGTPVIRAEVRYACGCTGSDWVNGPMGVLARRTHARTFLPCIPEGELHRAATAA